MLIIRRQQMALMELARRQDFQNRLLSHIGEELARRGTAISSDRLHECITRGIASALNYGFVSEKQVAGFVEATCVLFGDFPAATLPKPALAILCSYGLDPDVKLERYRQWAAARTAKVARVVQ